jgi:protein TonB
LSGGAVSHETVQLRIIHTADTRILSPQTEGDTTTAPVSVTAPPVSAPPPEKADPKRSTPTVDSLPATLPPAPNYRAATGLDVSPRALQSIDLEYPQAAGTIEGTVTLRLLISSNGDVDDVAVVSATPPGYFEASALEAFAKAKFSPGYFLGIPVKSQIFIEVGYTPINRGGAVSGQGR